MATLKLLMSVLGRFAGPLTVDAGANVSSSDSGMSACGNPGNTGTPGATVSGGVEPYTFLWEQIGTPAESGPYNVSNSAILNPNWGEPGGVCDGDSPTAETWRLTVTDDDLTVETDTITVTLIWVNTS